MRRFAFALTLTATVCAWGAVRAETIEPFGRGGFAAIRAAVDVPILANMTEFGKSDLFTVEQLRDVGVDLVIFPVSLLRIAMGAIERALDDLAVDGSLRARVPSMQTRARLYELLDYAAYAGFDDGVATFDLRNNRSA